MSNKDGSNVIINVVLVLKLLVWYNMIADALGSNGARLSVVMRVMR